MTMDKKTETRPLGCLRTEIAGFDELAGGGLPRGRTTLVVGSSGSCKTLFLMECLWRSLRRGEAAVLVNFEERFEEVCRNVVQFGWDLRQAVEDGKLFVIDASPAIMSMEPGVEFDLDGLLAQLKAGVEEVGAKLVVLDSLGTLFSHFGNGFLLRQHIYRIAEEMTLVGVTSLMSAERLDEYGLISRYGVEEYVSDAVVVLRNVLQGERCRRTIQALKIRGRDHLKGEFPFTLTEEGLCVLPIVPSSLTHTSSTERLKSGNEELDRIAGSGFFRDSIILVSGATGTGKTLLSTTFAAEGCRQNERTLILAYEESRDQLLRNAQGWGMDFEGWEKSDKLRVLCSYPEASGLEDHLVRIRREILEFRPQRLVVDSLSALERVGTLKVFREFLIGLSAVVKQNNICSLLTSTTPGLAGGDSITEGHISTLTDAIVVLRYVEVGSRLRRGIAVIKMRGSAHDKDVFEYEIDSNGIGVREPFQNVQGIILGVPMVVHGGQEEALKGAFGQ